MYLRQQTYSEQLGGGVIASGYRQQPHARTTEKWILMLYWVRSSGALRLYLFSHSETAMSAVLSVDRPQQ